jgi:hypothetical protein
MRGIAGTPTSLGGKGANAHTHTLTNARVWTQIFFVDTYKLPVTLTSGIMQIRVPVHIHALGTACVPSIRPFKAYGLMPSMPASR